MTIPHAVVDSSVAIKWVVDEEESDNARAIAHAQLEAPDLLLIECANILWKKVALADLSPRHAADCWRLLVHAPIVFTPSPELLDAALQISLDLNHPVYDCVFVALALRQGVPLITADRKLVAAIRKKKSFGVQAESLGSARN